ncbi:hypothetical protein QBC46DRAFT_378667 [Diplogelasinospora grovesii]|uniref:Uncharacterized protein n=1 Tax=Diplogelasinospora grovesii TaxID=303347 RepID=A0AAN6S778_9PEZI|nr:hypothetical protein QBC46DRAFT_378667 [Diplogelasinospora grovesii]
MCFGATCPTCSKQAWRGCGNHVASVFASVPEDKWCTCEPRTEINGKSYPPQVKSAMPSHMPSIPVPSWMKGWMGGSGGSQAGAGQ